MDDPRVYNCPDLAEDGGPGEYTKNEARRGATLRNEP